MWLLLQFRCRLTRWTIIILSRSCIWSTSIISSVAATITITWISAKVTTTTTSATSITWEESRKKWIVLKIITQFNGYNYNQQLTLHDALTKYQMFRYSIFSPDANPYDFYPYSVQLMLHTKYYRKMILFCHNQH